MNIQCQAMLVTTRSAVQYIEIVMLLSKLSYCDLDLEDSNPFLHTTLWLMCHRTGFSYKRLSDLEDIIQTNINSNV